MNCDEFNDRLPEYLDDALSTVEKAAARDHSQCCDRCQRVVAHERAHARSLRVSFDHEVHGLALRPETRRNILRSAQAPRFAAGIQENIRALFTIPNWRHVWVGALVVGVTVLVGVGRSHRPPAVPARDGRITYVVDVPIQTETHVYRARNNMVVDAVVSGVGVIDGRFSEEN